MSANHLDRIAIVLVEPRGPLNVGAAARAMKNMGLGELVIVGELDPLGEEVRRMAAHSEEILERARRLPTLEEALRDRGLVVGTTARGRHRQPTLSPREAAPAILAAAARSRVAVVFGREDHGLSADELALCHLVLSAPTSAERTSLNLAQAVLLVAYELFQASDAPAVTASSEAGDLLEGAQLARLETEMIGACVDTGYLHAGNRLMIEESMRRLLRLGPIQTRDARHLFGLIRRMGKILAGEVEPGAPTENEP
ncbi:MAG: TrmJ/YjtD family RNA methyltransferase [Planctomycetes bacterium]|nr:TrmJ/YjtD family RNA methyltransferase [Planctomycetota bacterium]